MCSSQMRGLHTTPVNPGVNRMGANRTPKGNNLGELRGLFLMEWKF